MSSELGVGGQGAARTAARLAAIERFSRDGLCAFAPDGRLLRANAVACRLLGLEAETLPAVEAGWFCDATGRRLARALDPVRAVAAEGVTRTVELLWRRPDGELTQVSLNLVPLPAAGDEPAEVLGVLRDTAATTALSEQLGRLMSDAAQQRHLLDLVFENVDSGIALVDSDDRLALWNRPFERVWGLAQHAAEGLTTDELLRRVPWDFTAAQRRTFRSAVAAARESLDPVTFEVNARSALLHFYTCRLAGGRRLWAVRDLTERWRMTAALEAAREAAETERRLLQLVVTNVEEALLVVAADGLIIITNPVFRRVWQVTNGWLAERTGDGPGEPSEGLRLAPEQVARLEELATAGPGGRRDAGLAVGSSRFVHIYAAGLPDGSRLYSLLDTTAQRGLEASLEARNEQLARAFAEQAQTLSELAEANRKLAESDRLKSEFLANTSHELRTPMNSILGYLDLISEGLYRGPEELNRWAATAHDSATSLLAVINALLEIARIEAGQMQALCEPVTLWLALDEVAEEQRGEAAAKQLGLTLPPADLSLEALVDPDHLRRVLSNVLQNAVKFTEEGAITVECGRGEGTVWLTVRDTGIGIPPDKLESIFDKFVQVDGSATRPYGGTGLGLSISRSLLQLQGGRIELSSAGSGQGTLVRVELPAA